jgi:DNA-binding beta-propeller fold protein YncE
VAIVDAYNDPDAESDLATYRSRYGISACTTGDGCFRKVNQTGGSSYPTAEAGWAVEISLDMDMVSAACPNCHILLVEASSNSNGDLYTAEDEAVALGATEVSNSWGSKEESSETSDDSYFHHTGALITAAAGDFGYEVEYPAASQYVIAVGGTTLTQAANSRGWSETAWSGTGSGCSAYEPKPTWQTASPDCTKRTNNDIAAVAAPETPVSVADSYELPKEFEKPEPGWTLVGGTSVSSPLMAGTMALANAYTKSFGGADAYYTEASQNGTGVLDDVTSGNNVKEGEKSCGNYLCEGKVGYDGPTGLGSPYGTPIAFPAPTVTKVEPASGPAAGGTTVTITGTNLTGATAVKFGSASATGVKVESASEVTAVSPAGSGTVDVTVSTPGGTSTTSSADKFSYVPAPTVETNAESSVTQTTATLNATVNPNGGAVSECKLEYGTTEAYGQSATCTPSPGSGETVVAVSAAVSGLSANTTYHFRVSATNAGGESKGADETFKTLASCTAEGFCASLTSYESSEVKLGTPNAVAIDPTSGDLWVAESAQDRVLEFNSQRKYLRQFGSEGSGNGQFMGIAGIATNSSGDVYVADTGNDRVQEFSPEGAYIRQFAAYKVSAIAVDSEGNVWVDQISLPGGHIQEFSSTGALLSQFGSAGNETGQLELAFGLSFSGGHLYVAELGRVQEFSSSGGFIRAFDEKGSGNGKSNLPFGIATDPTTGDLYVSETGADRVQKFSPEGSFIVTFGSPGSGVGQFSSPEGIAVGSSGTIYVADSGNHRVQEWVLP